MDRGYPLSLMEMRSLFAPGDLDPQGDREFADSYNLQKFVLNQEKGMDRWARQFYERMSGAEFSKYQYYLAIQSYGLGQIDESIDHLKKVLKQDSGRGTGSLAIHAARTLARIYYEKKQYTKSLDIYRAFLLKLNPIQPSDWIEAAWNEYFLKHDAEALGLLFNLESRAAGREVSFEKYALRALIYRDHCAVSSAEALVQSFEKDFGAALAGIKAGDSPRKYPELARVETSEGSPFRHLMSTRGIA